MEFIKCNRLSGFLAAFDVFWAQREKNTGLDFLLGCPVWILRQGRRQGFKKDAQSTNKFSTLGCTSLESEFPGGRGSNAIERSTFHGEVNYEKTVVYSALAVPQNVSSPKHHVRKALPRTPFPIGCSASQERQWRGERFGSPLFSEGGWSKTQGQTGESRSFPKNSLEPPVLIHWAKTFDGGLPQTSVPYIFQ